jgi:lysophospholipase L1-like esterase
VNLKRIRRLGVALAAAATLAFAGAAPSVAATPMRLAAIGDSYAAGVGAGAVLDACVRTTGGYAAILGASPNLACSGATTADVLSSQIAGIPRNTTDVTLTAGANDVGVSTVYVACAPDPTALSCQVALGAAAGAIPGVGNSIKNVVTSVKDRVRRPVDVVVTGYPLLFEPDPTTIVDDTVNAYIVALNSQIQAGAQEAGATYVDVTAAFWGHGIGSASPWINAPYAATAFHPNAAGYQAYAAAISPHL